MYSVSNDYKSAMLQNARVHRLTGTVGGVDFAGKDIIRRSFVVKNQLCEATAISLGGVYIGELDLTFSNAFAASMDIRGSWLGTQITAAIGVEIAADTYEDIPLGVYTVQDARWVDEGLKVVAYDNMAKFDRPLAITQASGELYNFLTLFCQECGVALGMTKAQCEALPNGDEVLGIYSEAELDTYRDAISQLAAACCCFATMDRSGRLVLRQLPDSSDIVDTIPAKMRSSTAFSDFTSYYDTITVVNMADETLSTYSNENVNGLTMNLGSNPFLQYGTTETKNRQRQAIADALEGFAATPFSVTILSNPAYDLGDQIQFSGGYGMNSVGCIMSFNYQVDFSDIDGYGENPALSDLRSKTDKEISGLIAKTQENEVIIHTFENADSYELDSELQEIISIRFATVKPKIINLWHEIELDVTADPEGDGIVTCQAVYVLNDETISYSPVTTWDNDGLHLMHLLYFLSSLPENQAQRWQVFLKVNGGTATINVGDIHASLYGQGLAAVGTWGGLIEVADDYSGILNGGAEFGYTDAGITFDWRQNQVISITENYDFSGIGGATFDYTDSGVDIETVKTIYNFVSEDKDYRVVSEDGQYNIESEG